MSKKFKLLLWLCLLLIGVQAINMLLGYGLNRYGIWPRDTGHLTGILVAPFLHGSIFHLANNLVGLCIFSSLCFVHSLRRFLLSSLMIIVLTGLFVWVFGRSALHIGASGWVFGLWSLCVASAVFERKLVNILVALVVIVFYGSLIYGILPRDASVSFESHLGGAIAGILCAWWNARYKIK
jgi:membrane associated rhomboid family serine protease